MRRFGFLATCDRHLADARETYFEHLRFASTVALLLIGAGCACLIHAVLPMFCEKTASLTVRRLTELFEQRHILPQTLNESSGLLVLVGLLALSVPGWTILLSAAGSALVAASAAIAFAAIPLAYLATNPQLDPLD